MKEQEIKKIVDERLETLLGEYHHYKYMTGGFLSIFKGWFVGMNLGEFMQWLKSKNS